MSGILEPRSAEQRPGVIRRLMALASIGSSLIGSAFIGSAFIGSAFIGSAFIGSAFIGSAFIGSACVATPRLFGAEAGAGASIEIHVDPLRGVDDSTRIGGASPFATIAFALAAYEDSALSAPGDSVRIVLAAGTYVGGEEGAPEVFPLRIPATIAALEVLGPDASAGGDTGAAVLRHRRRELPFFAASGEETASWTFRRLSFIGGYAALAAVLSAPRSELVIEDCAFRDLDGPAIEWVVGPGARSTLRIARSRVESSGGAVAIEALAGASCALDVDASEFVGFPSLEPSGLVASAIELHRDAAATIDAQITRSRFRDTPTAILLTGQRSEAGGAGAGAIELFVESSLFVTSRVIAAPVGPVFPWPSGVHRVVHASLPGIAEGVDRAAIVFVGNTFAGVRGAIVSFADATVGVAPAAGPAERALEVRAINNAFWGDAERPLGGFVDPPSVAGDIALEYRRNASPGGWAPASARESLDGDPGFVAPESDDFRPRADSILVDASDAAEYRTLGDSERQLDIAGECRVAGPSVDGPLVPDIGAFELAAGRFCRGGPLRRGDCDRDGDLQLTDAITLFAHLFLGGRELSCPIACDANASDTLDLTDGIVVLGFLFLGERSPSPPFSEPGFVLESPKLPLGCASFQGG